MSSLENPFAFKPESDLATAPLSGRVNLPAFVSPLGLRSFTQLALVVFCLFSFVQMGSSFMQVSLLNEAVSGPGPDWQQRATSNDQREIAVTLVQLVIFIVVGIISLKLLHRLRSNVDHLGASGLDSTPGWSVGWFFFLLLICGSRWERLGKRGRLPCRRLRGSLLKLRALWGCGGFFGFWERSWAEWALSSRNSPRT